MNNGNEDLNFFMPNLGSEEKKEETQTPPQDLEYESGAGFMTSTYCCEDCSTFFSTTDSSNAVSCIYCGSIRVKKSNIFPMLNTFMIPLNYTLKDAIKIYQKKIKQNPFLPEAFKNLEGRIRLMYLPGYLCDITTDGRVIFIAADKHREEKVVVDPRTEYKKKEVNEWTENFEVGYTTHTDYNNLFISAYSKIGEELLSSMSGYDYTKLIPYNPDIIAGNVYINGDIEEEKAKEKILPKALKHSINIVRGNIKHQLKKVVKNDITENITPMKNILVPLYFLKIPYEGKNYYYLMNGQTGEVSMDIVVEKKKIKKLSLLIFVILLVTTLLLTYFI